MLVYCITNKLNGKKYVGQTRVSLESRWKRHCWNCTHTNNMAIALAIKKYGKENFAIEKLCDCSTLEELCAKEREHIAALSTLVPNGYNLTKGGEHTVHAQETIDRIAAKNRGKKVSQETRDKLRIAGLGRKMTPSQLAAHTLRMQGKKPGTMAIENSRAACAKTYSLLSQDGNKVSVVNMRTFCFANGLSPQKMCEVVKAKRTQHKGWRLAPPG